jgi:hypothetical protein
MTLKPHPLKGPNKFKLGVFSMNADGGLAMTAVPERWGARWTDNMNAATIADRAGLEFSASNRSLARIWRPDTCSRMVVRNLHMGRCLGGCN